MRKVIFNKWIPIEFEGTGALQRRKEGTGCYETEFKNYGIFHQWGNSYEESDAGFGNYTVAIVELSDGTIAEVLPSNIKFVDNERQP